MSFTSVLPTKLPLITGVRALQLTLQDYTYLSEVIFKTPTRTIEDSITVSEVVLKRPAKVPTDLLTITEVLSKSPSKTLQDTTTLTEVLGKSIEKYITDTTLLYDYMGWVYPYYDPIKPIEKLVKVFDTLLKSGVDVRTLIEDPYIIYLLRLMTKKMRGEI